MDPEKTAEPAVWVRSVIAAFLDLPAENTLWQEPGERAWAEPLIGFSCGDDPFWERLKEAVGAFHWLPAEIFSLAFADAPAASAELTVISWVLPQTSATKADNRRETAFPSHRWARTRTFGEEINNRLKIHLVKMLQAAGHDALAPTLHPDFVCRNSEPFGLASNWSERHVAHVSGLGTFGLCDGLITPVGKAMRLGSVVARIRIPPTPRPYSSPNAYCLFYSGGKCRKCISRCPANAISDAGHDKARCMAYLIGDALPYIQDRYGFAGYSCGLCQTGVPCETKIPVHEPQGPE